MKEEPYSVGRDRSMRVESEGENRNSRRNNWREGEGRLSRERSRDT